MVIVFASVPVPVPVAVAVAAGVATGRTGGGEAPWETARARRCRRCRGGAASADRFVLLV
jgi:hypothetical protein